MLIKEFYSNISLMWGRSKLIGLNFTMRNSAFLFILTLMSLLFGTVVYVDDSGDDGSCVPDDASKPCKTLNAALGKDQSNLTIIYGISNNTISIADVDITNYENFTLKPGDDIVYPFAQLDTNNRPLLNFNNITSFDFLF